jgi:hypothetical protein
LDFLRANERRKRGPTIAPRPAEYRTEPPPSVRGPVSVLP